MIKVRLASIDDARDIVEIHCSDINKWYRDIDGKKVEAKYEDLTISERFLHGGPWMSIETCIEHLNNLYNNGQYPIVALYNEKVVGELELYIGYEKNLGEIAYIDILEVHREYRGRGIGSILLNKAVKYAKREKCKLICVWPAKEAINFYKKYGLRNELYNIISIDIETIKRKSEHKRPRVGEPPAEDEVIREMFFISPRIYMSSIAYKKYIKYDNRYVSSLVKRTVGYLEDIETFYVIENIPDTPRKCRVALWIKDKDKLDSAIEELIYLSNEIGYNKINMYLDTGFYEKIGEKYRYDLLGKEKLLYMKIR